MFSWAWLIFASLTTIGAVVYNSSVRVATESINPFLFTLLITATAFAGHIIAFLIYVFLQGQSISTLPYSSKGLMAGIVAGIAIVVIDLAFFFAVRSGGLAITNAVWVVGGTVLTAIIGYYVFKETLDAYKIAGLFLGALGLVLLVKPS